MGEIIDFYDYRHGGTNNPLSPSVEIFDPYIDYINHSDDIFIDKIFISSTGSAYINPTVSFTMITGSVISSASAIITVNGSGNLDKITLVNNGVFESNSIISASVIDVSGSNGSIFILTDSVHNIDLFRGKSLIYDSFSLAKEKIKLLLYTKKGEIPRMKEFGTDIYAKLLNFEQIISVDNFISEIKEMITTEVNEQVPEVSVLHVTNNELETDIDRNRIGISIVFIHKLSKKTGNMNFQWDGVNIIREHFMTEENDSRPIKYFNK